MLPALVSSLHELPFGSQAQIRVREGQLSAFLAYAGYDKRIGTVKYALRVLNNTSFSAHASLFVDVRGTQLSAYPLDVEVAPYSMRDDIIPVRMDVTGPFDRAIVEIASEETCFTVEAPPPPKARPQWNKWCALAAIPIFATGAAQLCAPRILGVAAPARAIAGTTLHIPYQVSGLGSVEYDFDTRDGLQLAAGLATQSGVLNLQVPRDGAGAPYTLHVRMRNAFSKAEESASIAAIGAPVVKKAKPSALQPFALIDNLAVSPSPAIAGKTIAVNYATQAQSGEIWLLDSGGATWAHVPMSLYGTTQISVPQAAAGREMRIVLHAQRGTQHAESSVGITVMPSQQTVAQASAPPATVKSAAPKNAQLSLSSQVVSPGDTVVANVSGMNGDVRITMMSSGGATLAQGDAGDSGGVTLTAPNVSTPTTFFIVATLTNGVSQQSIVKRLVVTPR